MSAVRPIIATIAAAAITAALVATVAPHASAIITDDHLPANVSTTGPCAALIAQYGLASIGEETTPADTCRSNEEQIDVNVVIAKVSRTYVQVATTVCAKLNFAAVIHRTNTGYPVWYHIDLNGRPDQDTVGCSGFGMIDVSYQKLAPSGWAPVKRSPHTVTRYGAGRSICPLIWTLPGPDHRRVHQECAGATLPRPAGHGVFRIISDKTTNCPISMCGDPTVQHPRYGYSAAFRI
jgi:hypothetical protein